MGGNLREIRLVLVWESQTQTFKICSLGSKAEIFFTNFSINRNNGIDKTGESMESYFQTLLSITLLKLKTDLL